MAAPFAAPFSSADRRTQQSSIAAPGEQWRWLRAFDPPWDCQRSCSPSELSKPLSGGCWHSRIRASPPNRRCRPCTRDGFFAALTQATLESVPPATDSSRAIADYHCVGARRHSPFRRRRCGFNLGCPGWRVNRACFCICRPPVRFGRSSSGRGVSRNLLGCGSDIAVSSYAMHDRTTFPLRAVSLLVARPSGVESRSDS